MKEVLSRQNAKFKGWLSLLEARGSKRSGLALLSGRKLVNEFLTTHRTAAVEILLPPKGPGLAPDLPQYRLASALFQELDTLGTRAPLAVVQAPPLGEWQPQPAKGLELIVALSDPGNLGAVLRSAEAFGVGRIILAEEAASPFLPKALRAASLATFRLPMVRTGPLASLFLKESYGLHMMGEDIASLRWPENLHLVLGEEGRGLPEDFAGKRIRIPMAGALESLNAMAAASIALYCYRTSFPKALK